MTATRLALALGTAVLVSAGCAASPPASANTEAERSTRFSSTASPTPTHSTEPTTALVRVTYRKWSFTAMRPESWTSHPYEFLSPEEPTIGFLSNDELTKLCQPTTSGACFSRFPLRRLSPHGVLITWRMTGIPFHDSISDFPGKPLSVDGSPARLEEPRPATDDCRAIGGTAQIVGTALFPHDGHNFLQMTACIGPDAGEIAEVEAAALFGSVEFIGG